MDERSTSSHLHATQEPPAPARRVVGGTIWLISAAVVAAALAAPHPAARAAAYLRHAHVHEPPRLFSAGSASSVAAGESAVGERAVAHRAGARRAERGGSDDAPTPQLHPVGSDAWEPTLGITPSGDVFVTALEGMDASVFRSRDRGNSWEIAGPEVGGVNRHPTTLDPYLYVAVSPDADNARVYTVDLYVGCSLLSYSDDGGATWVTNPAACGKPGNDHQTLFGGPPVSSTTIGYPNVLYYCWNDIPTGYQMCSKSLDGGLTFIPTGAAAFPPADCDQATGHGFVGRDGTVYLPRASCQPELAISRDEGATWTVVQPAGIGTSGYHEAAVAADRAGNVYYVWMAKDRLPYLVVSRDRGKTWSKPMMIGAPGLVEANLPSLDVGGNGKIAIAYMGSTNSPGAPWGGFAGCLPGCFDIPPVYDRVTWNGYITMTANALADRPLFYTAAMNDPADPMVRRTCGPGRCVPVGDFIDVEIGPEGTPWAVFVDGCIADCTSDDRATNNAAAAVVGRLVGGPSLR